MHFDGGMGSKEEEGREELEGGRRPLPGNAFLVDRIVDRSHHLPGGIASWSRPPLRTICQQPPGPQSHIVTRPSTV